MRGNASLVAVGTYTADIILHGIDHIAGPGEVIYLESPPQIEPGGHAVNVSIDYARLGGGSVVSVGAVGRDWFGDFLKQAQEKQGVTPVVEEFGDVGTARNIIIVVRGEDRRFHVYRGANRSLTPDFVKNALVEQEPPLVYLAVGFSPYLDDKAEEIVSAVRDTLIYADPAYTQPDSVKALHPLLDRAHFVHINKTELKMLTNQNSVEEALRQLTSQAKGLLLVTSGEGVIAYNPREGKAMHMPSFNVESRDPTGAGDAFSAGFLAWVSQRGVPGDWDELAEALLFAQASGAAAVMEAGATTGVLRRKVEELVEKQGDYLLSRTRVVSY